MTELKPARSADVAMTSAEFRVLRERLGVTAEWLAERLPSTRTGQPPVTLRTVRRWDHGHSPVSGAAAEAMYDLADQTADFVDQVLDVLADDEPDEMGELWVTTYASDEAYRLAHPDTDWPASWHRAAMGRVAEADTRVRLSFVGTPSDDDEGGEA